MNAPTNAAPNNNSLASSDESAHNSLILKWGTLKGCSLKTPEAIALLKRYHEDPTSWGCATQHDTPKQKETILALIDLCDEIWLDWEGKQVSREEAKQYIQTYGQKRANPITASTDSRQ